MQHHDKMIMPSENKTFPSQGKYTCPMHSDVVSDNAGHCHKCGMKLVPMSQQNDHRVTIIDHYNSLYWTHATIILLGFFLIAAPFTFGYHSSAMTYSDIIVNMLLIDNTPPSALYNAILSGIAIIILSIRKVRIVEKYGTFDSCII